METIDVLKRHEKRFNKIRAMVKFLLIVLLATIAALQYKNIIHFFKWFFN